MKDYHSNTPGGIYMVLDSALAQELITINEFRKKLDLPELADGNVTVKGNDINKVLKEKASKANNKK